MKDELYPIAIVEFGDQWIAIGNYWDSDREDFLFDPERRYAEDELDDVDWLAIGNTPNEAYDNLRRKNET